MKNLVLASGCMLAFAASPAVAGSLADPVLASEVVVADAVHSSNDDMHGMLALLTIALILGAAMGAGG